jgi:hypothetical protein
VRNEYRFTGLWGVPSKTSVSIKKSIKSIEVFEGAWG